VTKGHAPKTDEDLTGRQLKRRIQAALHCASKGGSRPRLYETAQQVAEERRIHDTLPCPLLHQPEGFEHRKEKGKARRGRMQNAKAGEGGFEVNRCFDRHPQAPVCTDLQYDHQAMREEVHAINPDVRLICLQSL